MAKHASDYPGIFRRSPVVYSRYNIASAYSGYRFQPFIKCAKMRKLCNLPRSEHASDIARMYDFRKAKTRFPIDEGGIGFVFRRGEYSLPILQLPRLDKGQIGRASCRERVCQYV